MKSRSHLRLVSELEPEFTSVVDFEETGECLYALQPKQLEAYNLTPVGRGPESEGPDNIGYGGAAGGGKSYLSRAVLVSVALQWPGSTSIIFRKTEREVMENHVNKFRMEVPERTPDGERLYTWNGEEMCAIWFNGSRTYFGYLRLDDDVLRYQGPEYDCMVFEEATHYSWYMIQWLTGNRLRATVPMSRPFCLYPSNPGGKGHSWYKRLFVEKLYHADAGEVARDYAFVQARLVDNQVLCRRDPKYALRLNKLPSPWREWQRDGDFGAGAGGAFAELDRHVHFVKPFPIPPHWTQFGAFDWGYRHPFAFGWYAIDEDGGIWKLATITGMRLTVRDIYDRISHKVQVDRLAYIVAGHDLWSQMKARGIEGESLWEQFCNLGMVCTHADIHRIQGYQALVNAVAWKHVEDGKAGQPRLRFFDEPGNQLCFKQIENMVSVDNAGEDVLKVDADERGENGDDLYDETRYAVMSARRGSDTWQEPAHTSAFSKEALAYEYNQKMRLTDDLTDDRRDFHPEFGKVY